MTTSWRLSLFRLLLFAAFSYLSLQATRNSHQFAAVVGSVTAWNFAEWAAAIRRRRAERIGPESVATSARAILLPRLAAAGAIAVVLAWVGSGLFYRMTGEGRTISLGEEPLFFAHEAAKFSGRPEMPAKFISFHNGHASLFEFYNGPERKVYTDPRLEVAGASFFKEYLDLDQAIKHNGPGWQAKLDQMGRPVVMVDHEYSWADGATMLGSAHWRCVWFDPIVAVFVHDSAEEAVRLHAVDFATRHFRPEATSRDRRLAERRRSPKPSAIISEASRPIARTWSGRSSGSAWTNAGASSATSRTRSSAGRCSGRLRSGVTRPRRPRPALVTDSPSTPSPTYPWCGRPTPCAALSRGIRTT